MTSNHTHMVPFFHCKHSQVTIESVTNPAIPACSPGGKVCADKDGLLAVAVVAGKLCDGQAPTVQRHITYSAAQHYLGALYTSLHAERNASEFTERGSACAGKARDCGRMLRLRLTPLATRPPGSMLGSLHVTSFHHRSAMQVAAQIAGHSEERRTMEAEGGQARVGQVRMQGVMSRFGVKEHACFTTR